MSLTKPKPLRINTDSSSYEPSSSVASSPLSPNIKFTEIPSFRLSTSTNEGNTSTEPLISLKPTLNNQARDEGRKLLIHVLTQLRNRPMPPSVSEAVGIFRGDARNSSGLWNLKDIMKGQIVKLDRGQHGDEDSDEEDQTYSTDVTFNLMLQLQEIMVMSLHQGWHIFDDHSFQDTFPSDNIKPSSPFRRSRTSFQSGRKSRSPSPNRGRQIAMSELLDLCISILASIIAEDCRFQSGSPRPTRPPNALQAVTLNVAQIVLHTNSHKPRVVAQIGLALIPAFSTFGSEMYPRLISFFDQCIIKGSLSSLRRLQGFDTLENPSDASMDYPLVSIHVDEAIEDKTRDPSHSSWVPWSLEKALKVQSTNAPAQPLPVYYMSSIISPLLGSVLDNINLDPSSEKDSRILQSLQDMIFTIMDQKVDAYSDILQVAAYHTPRARKSAATMLASLWPQAVGHVVVTQFPTHGLSLRQAIYDHHFVPWQFKHRDNWFSPDGSSQHDCHMCKKAIYGFGLLCPYCICAVHFDCYDHSTGSALVQFSSSSDPDVRRLVMYRFSDLASNLPIRAADIGASHQFHSTNLFTLCLCFECHNPLWGCTAQGLRCVACSCFVHEHCVERTLANPCEPTGMDASHLTIEWTTLRRSYKEHYSDILDLSQQDLSVKSFEEISVFRDTLSTQLHILENGLAAGTLLVTYKNRTIDHARRSIPDFEIHHTLQFLEQLLSADSLYVSPALDEYLHENALRRQDHSMLYTWSSLVYLSAAMKSPSVAQCPSHNIHSDQFLNVTQIDAHSDAGGDEISHPFEMVSISHMRDVLGHEFHIYSDPAAYILLSHLHHLAFFNSVAANAFSCLESMRKNKDQSCFFALPLGLDLSIDVETLVSTIEACLSDIDLFVNEFGFLLLIRRMWPDGLMSDYGLKRLARAVFSWIIREETHLAVILRDYVAKNMPLPGVRTTNPLSEWPGSYDERPQLVGSVQNGGDYLAARHVLLQRYAQKWLLALHNQDINLYADTLFNACDELADTGMVIDTMDKNDYSSDPPYLRHCECVLQHILRLSHVHVLFTTSDNIYLQWLELVQSCGILGKDVSLPFLLKLFPRSTDNRTTTMVISTSGEALERSSGLETNPWQTILDVSQQSGGFTKAMSCLNLLCRSGIECPLSVYEKLLAALEVSGKPLKESCLFIKAIMASLWLRSIGRQNYQALLAKLHLSLVRGIHDALRDNENHSLALDVVRYTFASCLLLYGCERAQLVASRFIEEDLVSNLPPRRKMSAKEPVFIEPIVVDFALMKSIEAHIMFGSDDITTMVVKFLYTFLTSSSLLESHEADNFIIKNERLLSMCAWQFYGIQRPEISSMRTFCFLRILSVDAGEFDAIVEKWTEKQVDWEKRALAATRLFRIVQDVNSPAFNIDGRQWKSSVTNVLRRFFSLLWLDSREEVRVVVKTHCASLLPAHFEIITSCFDETLLKSPIFERVKLISFLAQLRVHFPRWKVLSWDSIHEILSENVDIELSRDEVDKGKNIAEVDSELAQLKVSLIVLALGMLSDGISANGPTLIKLKAHLVRTLGFQNVSMISIGHGEFDYRLSYKEMGSIPEIAYPCIGELVSLMDSWYKTAIPPSIINKRLGDNEKETDILVGTVFADVPLNFIATYEPLSQLPVLVLKNALESFYVILYKHDFESRKLSVFPGQILRKALTRILEVLEANVPHEVRQVAFGILQAFVKKSTSLTGHIILNIVERVLDVITMEMDHTSQDFLVEQECLFIAGILDKYCKSGLFANLLKRSLKREIFETLKHVLDSSNMTSPMAKNDLTIDTFMRFHEVDASQLQNFVNNLEQFIDVVHHQNFTAELMGFVGKQLSQLAQRMSDGSSYSINASPLLGIVTILLKHNKSTSQELLAYLEILLRVIFARLRVNSQKLSQFLVVAANFRRRTQNHESVTILSNLAPIIFEILGDGLRLKTRLHAGTLESILEATTTAELASSEKMVTLYPQEFVGLADACFYWLENYHWMDGQTEQDFHASFTVAKTILQLTEYKESILEHTFTASERHIRSQARLRSWNILIMAALSEARHKTYANLILEQLKQFSATYLNVLSPYVKVDGFVPDSATANINQAYLAIKLWLIIAKQSEEVIKGEIPVYDLVWNELWPPFQNIVTVLENEVDADTSSVLAGFVSSSIADLFIFIRMLKIPLALQKSAQLAMLDRLQRLGRGDSLQNKINRAMGGHTETSHEISLEILIDQSAKDIIAAEKLRLIESKQEGYKQVGDRRAHMDKKAMPDRLKLNM